MTAKKLIFMIVIGFFAVILLFVGMMIFSWRSDVSNQEPYKSFLNTPILLKQASVLTTRPFSNRFEKLNLTELNSGLVDEKETKKKYKVGDTIKFHSAKSFYSMHIGTSYHLLGKDTLKSGKVVEYEYYLSDYSPRLWETLEDFLARKEQEKK